MTRSVKQCRSVFALAAVLVAAVITAPAARADDLTLKRAFSEAVDRNLQIKIARAEQAAAAAGVALAESRFAVDLISELGLNQRAVANVDQGTQFRYDLALTKLFGTGTRFSLGNFGSQVWGRPTSLQTTIDQFGSLSTEDPFFFKNLGASGIAITLEQPLLGGAGFDVNEAPVRAAGALLEAAKVGLRERISEQLMEVEVRYWSWAAWVRAVDIRATSLDLARSQRKRTAHLIRTGRQATADALLAEQIVAERQDALFVAENGVVTEYERLYVLMGYGYAAIPRRREMPESFAQTDEELETLAPLLARADEEGYALAQARFRLTAVVEKLRAAEDAAWPRLDARASLEVFGTDANLGSAYGKLFANRVWRGGLVFTYPLGHNPGKAEAERLRARVLQQRAVIEEVQRAQHLEVARARGDIALALNRISLAVLAKQLATDKLRAEEERYAIGRTTMQNVRQFQEDLDVISLREVEARVQYFAARARLDHLLGRFLTERGIDAG